ncbi:MAG: hypothetical protein Q9178_002094 [Gyalolechia marmorata]
MAFTQPYQTPDLAAVLQTLSAYAAPKHSLQPQQQAAEDDLEEGEYDPTEFLPVIAPPTRTPQPDPHPHIPHPPNGYDDPRPQPLQSSYAAPQSHTTSRPPSLSVPSKISPQPPQPSTVDKASTITSYPHALRHTTSLLSTSTTLTARIRHLIRTAHDHERQWWTSRQSLVTQLSSREASRNKLNSVLATVGGLVTPQEKDPPVDVERELRAYDRKVYKAYREMIKATYMDLEKVGIPFFCIKEELVVQGEEGQEVEKGKVGVKELGVLRGRMVGFLEDMVKEDE